MFVPVLRQILLSFRLPTYAVLSVFVWQTAGLTNYAAAFETETAPPAPVQLSPWHQISKNMMALRDTLTKMRDNIEAGASGANEQAEAASIWSDITELYQAVRSEAAGTANAGRYEAEFAMLDAALSNLQSKATPQSRLDVAQQLLTTLERARHPRPERLDPSQLPHRATDRKPPEPQVGAQPALRNPLKVAARGDMGFLLVQGNQDLPTDADKQETLEVQCTAEINQLAASLGNNPVRMYEHVRNSYDFQPTWGSIKGSQAAYFSNSANAHDLSSLLIALYRCSDIPARYVHGTIEVPIERFVKWAGIQDPEQASSLFSSGGIPATLVSVNNVVEFVRMEHVWVKAYVDYTPSRGGVFIEGDRWVDLDPAYKEHELVQPVDLQAQLNIDGEGLVNTLEATGTQSPNSLTGVDFTAADATRNDVQTQLQALLANNSLDKIDELLGQKLKIEKRYGVLPLSANFNVVNMLGEHTELPAAHRYSITVRLSDIDSFGLPTQSFSHSVALPSVAAKRFTLTYASATTGSTNYLRGLAAPLAGETAEQQAALTPRSIDPRNVTLRPELKIEGAIVATGAPSGMGLDQELQISLSSPNGFANTSFTNTIVVGAAQAVSIDLGTLRDEYMDARQAKMQAIKDQLDNPPADLADLDIPKDDYAGELLYTGGLTYWGLQNTFNSVVQRLNNVTATRLPSIGLFSFDLTIVYGGFFGDEPIQATMAGLATDIDYDLQAVVGNTADPDPPINYLMSSGMMGSYLEGSVWDMMTSDMGDETNDLTGRGVSTAHVLAFANANNIPVFAINSNNWDDVRPQLSLPSTVISAIGTAVAQGKFVTVPQTSVTIDAVAGVPGSGWTGVGYSVTDKDTGAGAYLINGGRSGGGFQLEGLDPMTVLILGFLLLAVGVFFPAVAAIAGVAAILIGIYDFISSAQAINNRDDLTGDQQELLVGLLGAFAVIGVVLGLIGLTSFGLALPFLAIAMAFLFYAFMVALIVGSLADLAANINRRNNMLPSLRRRFGPEPEPRLAVVPEGAVGEDDFLDRNAAELRPA